MAKLVTRETIANLRGPGPDGGTRYTKEEIEAILRDYRFRYHRVYLPFGLHTGGDDRTEALDLVFPPSLAGKSVLDIGCAYGLYAFAAEERGAARVVGIDPWEDRILGATLLKDIKASQVEFLQRDILIDPPAEQFDYVIFLNVIHHVSDPFQALRQIAALTRETLVIEFPTLADPKFAQTLPGPLPADIDQFPLVGVSQLRKGVDQTFVFAPPAIERALLDHEPLFRSVEFTPSTMDGRMIAFCHK